MARTLRVQSSKRLGVLIDEKLYWDENIDKISKKSSKGIGAIKPIKHYLPKEDLNDIYNSLV